MSIDEDDLDAKLRLQKDYIASLEQKLEIINQAQTAEAPYTQVLERIAYSLEVMTNHQLNRN